MSKIKKYGTFGGVFTPSILTILGVIMYLRLPWIVGQGGLWMTIGIIVVAHIISITTGLSVASIATDKKVEAGGSYFMISRSLGFPIGGTLGIALFVGMSFSISLYLIGFSESFLDYWGYEKSIENIRIMGSLSLLAVSIITIISTSLAMKTQYFIMAAIVLSLISIIFGKTDLVPAAPLLSAPPKALGFAVLFSIFFPAVTGFEAGVSMSGDLENPKKSIPGGTIVAIIVGLFTYIGLAIFFAYRVDANELANNPGVLQKITLYTPLLLAGIWGATISSAIGSILGAPRILQATSIDRITPKFFAKGYGKTNEPRNALILTIIIAEAGILIGELDSIARVVSMFFIAAYSFLNLSCVIESWVSPDFRPEFRIPKWVGILGSVTCFVIMIQLDFIAMIGAVLIMSFLFLHIKKKELSLEGGDTLSSIWASIVRQGLFKLTQTPVYERNWRPNMLLFSGGSDSRPYLVEMAKSLADTRGVITNFHLIESEELTQLSRSQIIAEEVSGFEGVFSRKIECNDIYEEMGQISKYHGFSGMEPNTILLGRARSLTNSDKFSSVIRSFETMDYNVLMLDFNKKLEFGNRERIDVWWSGHGNNISFSILLVRFLQSSAQWQNANYRFCLIVEDRTLIETTERKIETLIDNYRVRAEINIIYNGLEKKPFLEIIKKESANASLTILGLPNYQIEDSISVAKKISYFTENLGSILWIKANTYFQEISIVPSFILPKEENREEINVSKLKLSSNPEISKPLDIFFQALSNILDDYYTTYVGSIFDNQYNLLKNYKILIGNTYKALKQKKVLKDFTLISEEQVTFFEEARKLIQNYKQQQVNADLATFQEGIHLLIPKVERLIQTLPTHLHIHLPKSEFKIMPSDSTRLKWYKRKKLLFSRKKDVEIKVPYQSLVGHLIREAFPQEINQIINRITNHAYRFINDINKITSSVNEKLTVLQSSIRTPGFDTGRIKQDHKELDEFIDQSLDLIFKDSVLSKNGLVFRSITLVNGLSVTLQTIDSPYIISKKLKEESSFKKQNDKIEELLANFSKNYSYLLSLADSGVYLFGLQEDFRNLINKQIDTLNSTIASPLLASLDSIETHFNSLKRKQSSPKSVNFIVEDIEFNNEKLYWEMKNVLGDFIDSLPDELEVLTQDSILMFEKGSSFEATVVSIPLRKFLAHSIETELIPEFSKHTSLLPALIFQNEAFIENILSEVNENIPKKKGFYKSILKEFEDKIIENRKLTSEKLIETNQNLAKTTETILDKINIFYLIRNSQGLGRMVNESFNYTSIYKNILSKFENFIASIFEKFLHGRSHALLLSKQLIRSESTQGSDFQNLYKIREQLNFNEEILNQIPFYYLNLFMDEVNFDKELNIGRKAELLEAQKIIHKKKNGILFIHGEPECGKSWLSELIANEMFDPKHIFAIFPGENRYTGVTEFYRLLSNSLKSQTNKNNFSANFPPQSVLIIDDLEMFWERKENGTKIINEILYLSEEISKDSLFIINLNSYTYKLLSKLVPLQSYTSGVIECPILSSKEIQDIIIEKHKKTGYKLRLNNSEKDRISNFQYAKLFNKIFDRSEGLIGNALKLWILSINRIDKDKVYIKNPSNLDRNLVQNIPVQFLVILTQLVLHRKITLKKLNAIIEFEEDEIKEIIGSMERCNLIYVSNQEVISINHFLLREIIHLLNNKDIL